MGEVEPSVEPMLELLHRMGLCDYLYRTCATPEELKYRLTYEWNEYCTRGSILIFSTHGGPDKIWLQPDDEHTVVHVGTLQEIIECEGRYIHFSGCNTFGEGDHNLKKFLDENKSCFSVWICKGHILALRECERVNGGTSLSGIAF